MVTIPGGPFGEEKRGRLSVKAAHPGVRSYTADMGEQADSLSITCRPVVIRPGIFNHQHKYSAAATRSLLYPRSLAVRSGPRHLSTVYLHEVISLARSIIV